MYTNYFGLREMPFSITPDPAYLYMSPRHQEALGHLLYGTGQYGGFVQLTGEVGTGKTTVVRTLLSQKLDNVDVAVILNPRQNEQEFVASICDELHVPYPEDATLKTLVDALNAHLLEAHAQGRRTVVIIDEAQNLPPEVLEQVRLLTNLETHKEKLLRIMLVGQPELGDLLARADLRQLAQRITARYHLTPLSEHETAEYVAHRLNVGGGGRELFPPAAIAAVHRLSRGVPRLVNVLCDRALLGAYAEGMKQVTPQIVERAAREVYGETPKAPVPERRWTLADTALVIAIGAIGGWWAWQATREAAPEGDETAAIASVPATAPASAAAPVTAPAPEQNPALTLDELLRAAQPLPVVLTRLVQVWNATPQLLGGENLCQALARERLECYKASASWEELRRLDRPAVLTLSSGRSGVQHVLLRALRGEDVVLDTAAGLLHVPTQQLDLLWTGEFLMLWRRETDYSMIGPQARGAGVAWLRRRLAEAEGRTLAPPVRGVFDEELRQALVKFQTQHGLDPDGLAGARTLIALSNLEPEPGTPRLADAVP